MTDAAMADAAAAAGDRRPGQVILALAVIASILCCIFMTAGLRGRVDFVLTLRGTQLIVFVQVAVAVAVSTVLFQTITANRILTPSIMGLDALYLLGQALLVFTLGGLGYAVLDPRLKFAADLAAMLVLAMMLFLPLFLRRSVDLGLMLLTGVVLGLLFRSLTSLILRLIDPNAFAVLQGASFADFADVRAELLAVGIVISAGCATAAWRARHMLDVVALGRDAAVSLGVDWRRAVSFWLMVVAALVAVATALVGPLAFLGLLVVAVAERLVNSRRHAVLLPAAMLVAMIVLVGGQLVLKHVLGGADALSLVIEFAGGLVFLALLFGSRVR